MLLKIFTSSIKVENVVESAWMSIKVELILFQGVGVAQLQNLKRYFHNKTKLKRNTLVYVGWLHMILSHQDYTKTSELKRNVRLSLPGMVGWPERVDQVWIQAVFPAFSTSPLAVETFTMMIMGLVMKVMGLTSLLVSL